VLHIPGHGTRSPIPPEVYSLAQMFSVARASSPNYGQHRDRLSEADGAGSAYDKAIGAMSNALGGDAATNLGSHQFVLTALVPAAVHAVFRTGTAA